MAHIVILTNAFPFFPGEQFLEEEMAFWEECCGHKIVILPRTGKGDARETPKNIQVSLSLLVDSRWEKIFWAFRSLFSVIFFRELRYLILNGANSGRALSNAFRTTLNTLLLASKLRRYIRRSGKIDVVYSYWNEVAAYAACILKNEGWVQQVISRAHGHDLYEYRRPGSYMPLKRQFVSDFDRIYLLSEEGRSYFKETYGGCYSKLFVSPLGVWVPDVSPLVKREAGVIRIASVSYCTPVKRLDKIMMAVCALADRHKNLHIVWTHIGGGVLFNMLKQEACLQAGYRDNASIDFLGELPNASVRDFFLMNHVDVFVNASMSEGMPVSIMEAMASGVPAVAPDIGGISNLVNQDTGVLINKDPKIGEIIEGIEGIIFQRGGRNFRENSKMLIFNYFNSEKNYRKFVLDILSTTSNDNGAGGN